MADDQGDGAPATTGNLGGQIRIAGVEAPLAAARLRSRRVAFTLLEQGDDVSDPKQGVSVANKFVGDGVKFVIGHFNSGVTVPASDVYAENGILFVTPSATNRRIPFIVRCSGTSGLGQCS